MTFDRNLSLEELEETALGEPEFGSALVTRAHQLYKKPLATFTVEDLRLMIGQELGLRFLVPLAVEILEEDPFVSGDYYHGDLLSAVLSIERKFWKEHPDLCWSVAEVTAGLPETLARLKDAIDKFEAEDC